MYTNYKALEDIMLNADPQNFHIALLSNNFGSQPYDDESLVPLDVIEQFIENFNAAIEQNNQHLILEIIQSFFNQILYRDSENHMCVYLLSPEACDYLENTDIMSYIIFCFNNFRSFEIHVSALQLLDYLISQHDGIFTNMFLKFEGFSSILSFINPKETKDIVNRSIQILDILSFDEELYPILTSEFFDQFCDFCLEIMQAPSEQITISIAYYSARILHQIIGIFIQYSPKTFTINRRKKVYDVLNLFFFPRVNPDFYFLKDIFPHLQSISIKCYDTMSWDIEFITKIFPRIVSITSQLCQKNIIAMYDLISHVYNEVSYYTDEKSYIAINFSSPNTPGLPWAAFKKSLNKTPEEAIAVLNVLKSVLSFDPEVMVIIVNLDIHTIIKCMLKDGPFGLKEAALQFLYVCLSKEIKDMDRIHFADIEMTELIISLLDSENESLAKLINRCLQQIKLLNMQDLAIQEMLTPILETNSDSDE